MQGNVLKASNTFLGRNLFLFCSHDGICSAHRFHQPRPQTVAVCEKDRERCVFMCVQKDRLYRERKTETEGEKKEKIEIERGKQKERNNN